MSKLAIFNCISPFHLVSTVINDQKQRRPNAHRNKVGEARREGKGSGRGHKKGIRERTEKKQGKEDGWIGNERQNQPGQGDFEPTGQWGEVEGAEGTAQLEGVEQQRGRLHDQSEQSSNESTEQEIGTVQARLVEGRPDGEVFITV